jgi:hypothetical protein
MASAVRPTGHDDRPANRFPSIPLVVGSMVLGFAVGRWSKNIESVGDPPAPRATSPAKRAAPAAREAAPVDLDRIGELERELALERLRAANLEVVAYGRAPTWPEEVPPGHRPEAFQAFVRQAIAGCGVDVDLAGFDCDEPPCMAIVRGGASSWFSDLTNCDMWAEMYGAKGGSMASSSVRCDDGTEEPFTLVGAPNGDYFADQSETDPLAFTKRMAYREEQIKFDYVCQAHDAQKHQ